MTFDVEDVRLVMELFLKQLEVDERILKELVEKGDDGTLKRNAGKKETYSLRKRSSEDGGKMETVYLGSVYQEEVQGIVQARWAKLGLKRIEKNRQAILALMGEVKSLQVEEIAKELPGTYQQALDQKALEDHMEERLLEIAAEGIEAKKHNEWPHKNMPNIAADGKKVRSKLEALVCLMLDVLQIPYDYDAMESLKDNDGRIVSRSPDFRIWTASRRRGFIEAVGKMGDEDYFEDFLDKLRIYHINNINLGDNLLVICDRSNQTTNCYAAMKFIQALAAS
ncbi:MAG: hypothetical protein IIY82_08185 [Firmicutes bacterium]|nr:hypothetical protein [Bacillota bacterium]